MSSRHAFFFGIGLLGVVVLAACSGQDPSDPSSPSFDTAVPDAGAAQGESTPTTDAATPPACVVDADCAALGIKTFCSEPACASGVCVRRILHPEGTPLTSQRFGDCREARCAADGSVVEVAVDDDVFEDGNACMQKRCTDGNFSSTPMPKGYLCSAGEICNASGACVACNEDVDCSSRGAGFTCVAGNCLGPSCKNGVKDPGEGDIDCGGSCPRCADGKTCTNAAQCASGVCSANACAAPTCNDGVLNGDETGTDCGGGTCPPCGPDRRCKAHADCASQVCIDGFCDEPRCTDAVKNGDEEGIDCGGSCPTACPN